LFTFAIKILDKKGVSKKRIFPVMTENIELWGGRDELDWFSLAVQIKFRK